MRFQQLALIGIFLIITAGCSGSGNNGNLTENRPYTFVKPTDGDMPSEKDKGGNDISNNQEEVFTPHPLMPLESSTTDKPPKNDDLSNGSWMYDLGLVIEPRDGSANNVVVDPMLESIRQDLIIKWGMDENGLSTREIANSTIPEIHKRITNLENSMKGDLAALRSENLLLFSKLQKLEKKIASKTIEPKFTKSYKDRYDNALADYRKRRFSSAIKKFNALLAETKNNNLSDNAQYWIGECYYHLNFYSKALVEFGNVLKYKNSNKKDSAILMRGKAYKHLGRNSEAIAQFQTIITSYPKSSYIKRARELISDLERI